MQLQFLELAKESETTSSRRELGLFRAERDEMTDYVHDRKVSLQQAQGHTNDTALHDESSIAFISGKLSEARKTHEYMNKKQEQMEKSQMKQLRGTYTKKEILQELNDNEYIESTEVAAELSQLVSKKAGTIPRRQHCRNR